MNSIPRKLIFLFKRNEGKLTKSSQLQKILFRSNFNESNLTKSSCQSEKLEDFLSQYIQGEGKGNFGGYFYFFFILVSDRSIGN